MLIRVIFLLCYRWPLCQPTLEYIGSIDWQEFQLRQQMLHIVQLMMDVLFPFPKLAKSKKMINWGNVIAITFEKGSSIQLTLLLMYSRIASGNESHCLWYCSVMEASLLVRWFLSCKPAAVRATELHEIFANTSDNAFRNSARFVAAACSRNCFAADNSFWSRVKEYWSK